MTDNTIDFNALLEAAVKQREKDAEKAAKEHKEEVDRLIQEVLLKVSEIASGEGDVRPALWAILDGPSDPTAPTLEPEEKLRLEARIAELEYEPSSWRSDRDLMVREHQEEIDGLAEQLRAANERAESYGDEIQQLRTDKGRLERELQEARSRQRQAPEPPVTTPAPSGERRPAKKAAAPRPTERPQGLLGKARERGRQALSNMNN